MSKKGLVSAPTRSAKRREARPKGEASPKERKYSKELALAARLASKDANRDKSDAER